VEVQEGIDAKVDIAEVDIAEVVKARKAADVEDKD